MLNHDRVQIEGNATKEAVLRKTKTGKSLCTFTVAINHYSKDGEEPAVSYIDVETWEKLAEICARTIIKGKRVLVFGSLRQDRWQDEDGKTRSKIKVLGSEVRFLEFPKSSAEAEQPQVQAAAV